jgi:hypothetical protein
MNKETTMTERIPALFRLPDLSHEREPLDDSLLTLATEVGGIVGEQLYEKNLPLAAVMSRVMDSLSDRELTYAPYELGFYRCLHAILTGVQVKQQSSAREAEDFDRRKVARQTVRNFFSEHPDESMHASQVRQLIHADLDWETRGVLGDLQAEGSITAIPGVQVLEYQSNLQAD